MKTIDELVSLVDKWAEEKGIHEKGNKKTQTYEEVGELIQAHLTNNTELKKDSVGDILVTLINAAWFEKDKIRDGNFSALFKFADSEEEIKDVVESNDSKPENNLSILNTILSDMLFEKVSFNFALTAFLINLNIYCYIEKIKPLECLEIAYDVISKRKGNMVNGTFVKDK